jgi:hypothetical protein
MMQRLKSLRCTQAILMLICIVLFLIRTVPAGHLEMIDAVWALACFQNAGNMDAQLCLLLARDRPEPAGSSQNMTTVPF